MAGPKDFSVRRPVAAGTFYPADPGRCRAIAEALTKLPEDAPAVAGAWGGIVPHAGWVCSGALAGQTLATLAAALGDRRPELVVVFGAVHTPIDTRVAALESHDAWQVPGGVARTSHGLAEELARSSDLFAIDDRLHEREHAIEVELPLIRAVWPAAALLPIEVPLDDSAVAVGERTARRVLDAGLRPVFLASSDLTHYGPSYRFAPAGIGVQGLDWAKQNDLRLLRRVEAMDAASVVDEVRRNANACGGGAIAAMLAACRVAGAGEARVLRHANSYETLADVAPQQPIDAVGYASVVVG